MVDAGRAVGVGVGGTGVGEIMGVGVGVRSTVGLGVGVLTVRDLKMLSEQCLSDSKHRVHMPMQSPPSSPIYHAPGG